MKKSIRYTLKGLKILLITLISLYLIAYIYVVINKKKLIEQVTVEMSKKLNGDVKVGKADISLFGSFPKIAVLVNDVIVTDTLYARHHHAFFAAKQVFVTINILKLIRKQSALTGLKLQNASVYLYTDSSGYTNTYMLKSKKDPAGGPKKTSSEINLKTISLDHVRITLDDQRLEKLHDFIINDLKVSLDDEGDDITMNADMDMVINSLAFNVPRGTFFKGAPFVSDFKMKYGKLSQLLSFDSIDVKLGGELFNLTGSFDLGDKNPEFKLRTHVRNADYEKIKALFPLRIQKSLSMVSLDKPVDADAEIYGPLHGGDPYVFANWRVKNTKLITQFLDFDDASFTGFYKNEVTPGLPRKDPNSMISVSNFTGKWHNLPVSSNNIVIMNLTEPLLSCDMQSAFPLTSLNDVMQTNSIDFTSGDAALQLRYNGPVTRNDNTNSFLNGSIRFKNGTVNYNPRDVQLKQLNGDLLFANSNVTVRDLRCNVLNNNIIMNGSAKNLLTLTSDAVNKVSLDWNVYSPSLNLASFMFLLKDRKKTTTAPARSQSLGRMSARIDDILEQSRIDLSVKADAVSYKKLAANNFDADITMLQDRYMINNVSMNTAGGRMAIKGQLVTEKNNLHRATVSTDMDHVDVKKIFYTFDNFGQDGITSNSLEGNLSSNINASMAINDAGEILPSSLAAKVSFSLKNGALINYEPIKKIQNYIFKKRDFDNITFAELKDTLEVNGGSVTMKRMEIQSSVLSLFIEGVYSKIKGSDISIQVPLNNLKKRDEDYNPVNIGTDKSGGRSIFLRGQTGKDGNVAFKLDLFNKYRKEKEKEAADSSGAKQ